MHSPHIIQTLENSKEELIAGIIALFNKAYLAGNRQDKQGIAHQEMIQKELTSLFDNTLSREITPNTRDVTILLSDLRGFTSLSEQFPATSIIEMLNRYFAKMCKIIVTDHEGEIDKFIGDSIMVLFGARKHRSDDLEQALSCAVQMQIAMDEINQENEKKGLPTLYMGIGINTGTVVSGKVGSELHSEYTVIGNEVNLASRIEAYSLRGQILISENTYQRANDFIETGDPISVLVKGKKDKVTLHELLEIKRPLKLSVPRRECRKSPRIEINMPFSYQRVEGKTVLPEKYKGQILDISYNGFLCVMPDHFESLTEIKLSISLSMLDDEVSDIYAKVLRSQKQDGQYLTSIEFTSLHIHAKETIKYFIDRIIQGG